MKSLKSERLPLQALIVTLSTLLSLKYRRASAHSGCRSSFASKGAGRTDSHSGLFPLRHPAVYGSSCPTYIPTTNKALSASLSPDILCLSLPKFLLLLPLKHHSHLLKAHPILHFILFSKTPTTCSPHSTISHPNLLQKGSGGRRWCSSKSCHCSEGQQQLSLLGHPCFVLRVGREGAG